MTASFANVQRHPRCLIAALALALTAASSAIAQCPLQFGSPISNSSSGTSVAVGDVDGDTKPDLATINQSSGQLKVLKGVGDGTFGAELLNINLNGSCCGASVRLVDVSGDQKLDIVTLRHGQGIAVLLNNGSGGFASPVYYDIANIPDTPVFDVGRLTNDALPDIVVPTTDGVAVLLHDTAGSFQAPVIFGEGQGLSARSTVIADASSLGSLGVAINSGTGRFLAADGFGGFELLSDVYSWGNGSRGLVAADMNGDGAADIVREEAAGGVSVSLYLGNGNYSSKQTFGSGQSWFLKAADFNGDGKIDILSASSGNLGSRIYLGNGDGTLQSPIELSRGSLEPAIGDLNGDGRPDIAMVGGAAESQVLVQNVSGVILNPLAATPALNGSVRALMPYVEETWRQVMPKVIVGGSFSKFGVTPMSRIGLFDGAAFTPMGAGLNGTVNALTNFDFDSGGPQGLRVVAAGAFSKSGSTPLPRVGAFDGTDWRALDADPVIPTAAANQEGTSGNSPLASGGTVSQLLYLPEHMPSLRSGDQIRGLTLRMDVGKSSYPATQVIWPRYDIALGVGKPALNQTFASNFVGKPTRVRTGPLTMDPGFLPGTGAPREFGTFITFSKPYTYTGGPLLIEIRSVAPNTVPITDSATESASTHFSAFANAAGPEGADLTQANPAFFGPQHWVIRLLTNPGSASGFNGSVNALVTGTFNGQSGRGADPVLVAGGAFTKSGTTTTNRVAVWNGIGWVQLGAGFNGAVNTLAIVDLDGPDGPDGPQLVAAGAFTKSGDLVVNRIAKLSGTQWQAIGSGFNGAVNALAKYRFADGRERLVAGGAFTKSGQVAIERVAVVDGLGENWLALGGGFNGVVNALRVVNHGGGAADTLYAGGAFTKSGKVNPITVTRLARLQGNTWQPVGAGAASTVRVLAGVDVPAPFNDDGVNLGVGGDFKKIGATAQAYFTAFSCPGTAAVLKTVAAARGIVQPCSLADIAGEGGGALRGDGQLTSDDLIAFLSIVGEVKPSDDDADPADTAEGETALIDDVVSFVQAYAEGCP